MDKSVKKIRPKDQELSMVQENLVQAIQQLLDYANANQSGQLSLFPVMQQTRGPGTPTSVKTLALSVKGRPDGNYQTGQPTMQFGEPAYALSNGQPISQKDALLMAYGQVVFTGSKGLTDGFVIMPQVSGLAFRVAPLSGNANLFQVATDAATFAIPLVTQGVTGTTSSYNAFSGGTFSGTTFTGNSFVSAGGFKNTILCGGMWNSNYQANANTQLQLTVYNTSTALGAVTVGIAPRAVKMPFSGSVVGASLSQTGTVTGANSLLLYRNGTNVYNWSPGTGAGQFWTTFAKNTTNLTFSAGDTFTFFIQNTTGGNCQITADITVEMSA